MLVEVNTAIKKKNSHLNSLPQDLHNVMSSQGQSSSRQRTPASIGVISLLGFDREDNVTMNSEACCCPMESL